MIRSLHGFRSMAVKEFIHIRRDPTTLVFALMIPAIQLTLFGYAVDFDVRHVNTAIVDLDRSRESRAYLTSIQNTQYIEFTRILQNPQQAEEALVRGDIRAAVVIPADFSRKYGTSTPPQVYVMLDGSDSQVANPARNAFRKPPTIPGPSTVSPDAVDVRVKYVMFNPEICTRIYTIPVGLVGVILYPADYCHAHILQPCTRTRTGCTLEQLTVSPVGKLGLMLGKLVPYACLALFEMFSVIFIARLMFNIMITGSFTLLLVLSVPFILASLSIGLLISTIAKSWVRDEADKLRTLFAVYSASDTPLPPRAAGQPTFQTTVPAGNGYLQINRNNKRSAGLRSRLETKPSCNSNVRVDHCGNFQVPKKRRIASVMFQRPRRPVLVDESSPPDRCQVHHPIAARTRQAKSRSILAAACSQTRAAQSRSASSRLPMSIASSTAYSFLTVVSGNRICACEVLSVAIIGTPRAAASRTHLPHVKRGSKFIQRRQAPAPFHIETRSHWARAIRGTGDDSAPQTFCRRSFP